MIFQQITPFISQNLSPYLCGFRKGFNAQHALMRLKNKLNQSLDKKQNIGLLMMDLSKAFDCISHDLLIAKLNAYGFSKDSLSLIHSYLKGRKQRVKINAEYSTWREIIDGVPQGSVLSPLLFNIFINDLFFFVENSDICNYADDNSLTVSDRNIDDIISKLQEDTDQLRQWFAHNGMILNGDKCQFMIIESSRNNRNSTTEIKIGGNIVKESKKGKLLGITFDNNITMKDHIKCICKQASNKLYALARISSYLDECKRKVLLKSFILSQFNYCPIIWMYCQRQSNNLINRIHERALRIAYNDYLSNFDALLEKDNAITIHERNIQALAIEIYKTVHHLSPDLMTEIFKPNQQHHSSRNRSLSYPNPRTVIYGLDTFGYKGSRMWGKIPLEIQNADSVTSFKNNLEQISENLCDCNICKSYIQNLGYIDVTS